MARKYHSLLERIDGRWSIQFGDFDREVVRQELEDVHEGVPFVKKKDLKIITTAENQAAIAAAVAKLNGE
jgi:hypothetical protein